ncbi:MAG: hypothetical protein KDB32_04870 [Planctomycetes bacterium]|nr:hypothetical protein [Planctomycetota bacterium]
MNLKTGILFVVFCVALGGVVVGQRLQIRSVGFEAAQLDRESRVLDEDRRVLLLKLAEKREPARTMREASEAGLPLIRPEGEIKPLPGKKKTKEEEEADKKKREEERKKKEGA